MMVAFIHEVIFFVIGYLTFLFNDLFFKRKLYKKTSTKTSPPKSIKSVVLKFTRAAKSERERMIPLKSEKTKRKTFLVKKR